MADQGVCGAVAAGLSPAVIPRPGYWPASVQLCGFWHSLDTFPPAQQQLPPALGRFVPTELGQQHGVGAFKAAAAAAAAGPAAAVAPYAEAAASPAEGQLGAPVCCDFGSMAALRLLPDPGRLLRVLRAAAELLGRRFLLQAGALFTLYLLVQVQCGAPAACILSCRCVFVLRCRGLARCSRSGGAIGVGASGGAGPRPAAPAHPAALPGGARHAAAALRRAVAPWRLWDGGGGAALRDAAAGLPASL